MARPRKIRFVQGETPVRYYKPQGIPMIDLVETVLPLDGLEALRLADVEGLEQTEAAQLMGVSRSTFSRLVLEARRAVATALVRGWAIRIEGGPIEVLREGGQGRMGHACCRHGPVMARDAEDEMATQVSGTSTVIAVSACGETPDAAVDPRFGRATGFVLYDPSTGTWSYLSNAAAQAQGQGAGLAAVEVLARAGVGTVLSGSIGPKAARALAAAGIASVEGADAQTARQAVDVHLLMRT